MPRHVYSDDLTPSRQPKRIRLPRGTPPNPVPPPQPTDPPTIPFNTLPTELISHIGLTVLKLYTNQSDDRDKFAVPSTLVSVCKRWRTVFNHTSALWSFLFIHCRTNLSHIQDRLRKSGGCLLEVTMSVDGLSFLKVAQLLEGSLNRWSRLLVNAHYDISDALGFLSCHALPSLVQLSVYGRVFGHGTLRLEAPNLQSLVLMDVDVEWVVPAPLTSLEIYGASVTLRSLTDTVAPSTQSLKRLEIDYIGPSFVFQRPHIQYVHAPAPISLPVLENLILRSPREDMPWAFLQAFSAPHTKHLHVSISAEHSWVDLPLKFPDLETIHWTDWFPLSSSRSLLNILAESPNIRVLHTDLRSVDMLVDFLLEDRSNGRPLMRCEKLQILSCRMNEPSRIRKFVEQRHRGSLVSLQVRLDEGVREPVTDQIVFIKRVKDMAWIREHIMLDVECKVHVKQDTPRWWEPNEEWKAEWDVVRQMTGKRRRTH